MDQFFTSLSKRQLMMLLTAITFGGQEGVAALEHLPEDEAELLVHRAQGILQIPRDKRIPLLVQEIKRLVKDRRGQLWSADPERLAALLKRERGALVEVMLRALPGPLAEAVRSYLPNTRQVKLTREVRPQILDIVRWKLEERLARDASAHVPFKFTDVLMLQARELLTVCDRLGARVLGPALAGVPEAEREAAFAQLPPHMRQLSVRAVTANAPRRLPEEEAHAQLAQYGGMENLAAAIRGAGVHRLARASVAQSAEFAARLVEKHRGEFGQILAKWVREERAKPTSRGDGGRTDIVTDLERLAARGLIDRPVRLSPPRPPALGPPPAMKGAPVPRRSSVAVPAPALTSGGQRRDPIAEREARRAGAASLSYADRQKALVAPEPARVSRGSPLPRGTRDGVQRAVDPGGATLPPRRSRVNEQPAVSVSDAEGSRIFRSPLARTQSRGVVLPPAPRDAAERPPRVVGTNPGGRREDTQSGRGERPRPGGASGRGPRGGTR
ncbi:hypothetical protein D187_004366 [Cystobacter fuscus DSM 2262]|uniref:Uncharacterized protein n=1 Tax=Cystobacter fuscus (strain ATCC 25194 / DSM 2262 / NBRC 100088 / M29) TaxID=1242864 RepID=S9P794_CYSF2|nr:hypothetical protein [Cystobacter fuscus]EPX58077.1 hypothetical protein D187_004366 [Cystobacter fuscus DSM 2262]